MDLSTLKALFADLGCQRIYAKSLAPNDNSKNQVYLGGSFEILNIFPISTIITVPEGDWERERFKASLEFSWMSEDGKSNSAPNAQLILYPKYPEVRFSGFLQGCENAPSELMTQRTSGRILFLSPVPGNRVLGYIVSPNSDVAREFNKLPPQPLLGVFTVIDLPSAQSSKQKLLDQLARIHNLDWIHSKRLDSHGKVLPCNSPNCGGYTLEAELGITPNGNAEPDFLGWEVKQFGVRNFSQLGNSTITLMTPEPDGGFYKSNGVSAFIYRYGYSDKKGRENRMNFGGVHRFGETHRTTELSLILQGFDPEAGKIRNSNGSISLIDRSDTVAASWSFSDLLIHWNKKHNQACYVPSIVEKCIFLRIVTTHSHDADHLFSAC